MLWPESSHSLKRQQSLLERTLSLSFPIFHGVPSLRYVTEDSLHVAMWETFPGRCKTRTCMQADVKSHQKELLQQIKQMVSPNPIWGNKWLFISGLVKGACGGLLKRASSNSSKAPPPKAQGNMDNSEKTHSCSSLHYL